MAKKITDQYIVRNTGQVAAFTGLILRYSLSLCLEALSGEGYTLDCEDFRWVSQQDLVSFELAKADKPIVEKLMRINK